MISLKNILSEARVVRYGSNINNKPWWYLPSIDYWFMEYDGSLSKDKEYGKEGHTEPQINNIVKPHDSDWLKLFKKMDRDDKTYVADFAGGYKHNYPTSVLKKLGVK